MSGTPKQKQKILLLLRILYEKTDEQHALTLEELIGELANVGVPCERKSLYRDLNALSDAGFTVGILRSKDTRYYWADRVMTPSDVAFLIHLLQANPMVSRKRKPELKKKLAALLPIAYRKETSLNALSSVPDYAVSERINAMTETLFEAIRIQKKVRFSYKDSAAAHRRSQTQQYTASPFRLIWKDGYYLVASDEANTLGFYRLDRMENLSLTSHAATDVREVGGDLDFDLNQYILGYFASLEDPIHMIFRVTEEFLPTAEHYFPADATVESAVDGSFLLSCDTSANETLFGWLLLHGEEIRLLYPESTVAQVRAFAEGAYRAYGRSEGFRAE